MWWKAEVKYTVERKDVLGVKDYVAKERCMIAYKEEKGKVNRK